VQGDLTALHRNPMHKAALEQMRAHTLSKAIDAFPINRRWIHPVDIPLRVFAIFVGLRLAS
jgi:hypothetical protein